MWDADGANERTAWRPKRGEGGTVVCLAWSRDGRRVASSSSGILHLWEVETGREVAAVDDHPLRKFDWEKGRPLASTSHPTEHFDAVAFAPDDQAVFVAATYIEDSEVRPFTHYVWVWNLSTNRQERTLASHPNRILALTIGPDGRSLVTAHLESLWPTTEVLKAHRWDLGTGRKLWSVSTAAAPGSLVAVSINARLLAVDQLDPVGDESNWLVRLYDLPP